jgi:hypothetical protein
MGIVSYLSGPLFVNLPNVADLANDVVSFSNNLIQQATEC